MTTKTKEDETLSLIQTLYQPSSTVPSTLIYKDTNKFKTRLASFTPIPNFTLPLSLSPIVLARFGWTFQNVQTVNTAPCMLLKCNCCQQELAITFHDDLNIDNKRILSRQYRKLVAERHTLTCGFHMDASRWLVMADVQDETASSLDSKEKVPFYLLSIAKEYEVMEDCTKFGDLTREWFQSRLKEYRGYEFDMEISKQVEDSVQEILKPSGASLVDSLELQEAGRSISDVNLYLTLFGWNVKKEEEATITSRQCRNVYCPLCLNECSLPIVNDDVSEPFPKRKKVYDDQNMPQFHLIHSHRYFCPMTCGFVTEENKKSDTKETVTIAGWEIILGNLMKGIGHETRIEEGTCDDNELENKKFDCSDVLLKIRESLRPMSSSPIKLQL